MKNTIQKDNVVFNYLSGGKYDALKSERRKNELLSANPRLERVHLKTPVGKIRKQKLQKNISSLEVCSMQMELLDFMLSKAYKNKERRKNLLGKCSVRGLLLDPWKTTKINVVVQREDYFSLLDSFKEHSDGKLFLKTIYQCNKYLLVRGDRIILNLLGYF